jgi:hypothetical protein
MPNTKQGWWSASSDRALVSQVLSSNASIIKKKSQGPELYPKKKGAEYKQTPSCYTCTVLLKRKIALK